MKAFEQIRENFINVFRSLFTEDDNCNLILEDEDNPLESKIEIIAKPKGKKPKVSFATVRRREDLDSDSLIVCPILVETSTVLYFR